MRMDRAKGFGQLATLGLGAVVALGAQVPALLVYLWWRGLDRKRPLERDEIKFDSLNLRNSLRILWL